MDIQKANQLINSCWGTSIDKTEYITTALHLDGGCQLFGDGSGEGNADTNKDGKVTAIELTIASNIRPELESKFDEMTKARILDLSVYQKEYVKNDPFPWKNIEVIKKFGIINDEETVNKLFNILTTDSHHLVRKEAAKMLGLKFGDMKQYAANKLLEALPAIENYHTNGVIPSAIPKYILEIKTDVFWALGELECAQASPFLMDALNNINKESDHFHVSATVNALCKIGDQTRLDEFKSNLLRFKKENILIFDCIAGEDPYIYMKNGIGVTKFNKTYIDLAGKVLRHDGDSVKGK